MQENELNYYERIGNWNFDDIKCEEERITNWDFYKEIEKYTNEKSLCLDLGTGGAEQILENYPNVGMIIATDFSKEMINTAKKNFTKYPDKNIKFVQMNNLQMSFPNGMFDLISARHTIINAKQIYNALNAKGTLVIEGINKKDCWQLKQVFGRGQAYNDDIAISEKDYKDIKEAGFINIEKVSILENEYYKTEEDLMALLLKTPILNDFLETNKNKSQNMPIIEMDLFKKYVEKYQTEKGILLERVLYGIVARK
jgi:trans-aconitate methyltransferase